MFSHQSLSQGLAIHPLHYHNKCKHVEYCELYANTKCAVKLMQLEIISLSKASDYIFYFPVWWRKFKLEQRTHMKPWYPLVRQIIIVHYFDVMMGAMASQITSFTIVCSSVYSGAHKKNKAPRDWPLWGNSPVTDELPAQRASSAENVSIVWRHHAATHLKLTLLTLLSRCLTTRSREISKPRGETESAITSS